MNGFAQLTTPDGAIWVRPERVASIGKAHIDTEWAQTDRPVRWIRIYDGGYYILDTPENMTALLGNVCPQPMQRESYT